MPAGEIARRGCGAGLYGMLVIGAIVAVFIAGLMVGRTPEYLGKKIESFEMKMAMVVVLILGASVLGFTAIADRDPGGSRWTPQPWTARLLRDSSTPSPARPATTGRRSRDSPATRPFYNVLGALAMLVGRFGMIVPVLAIAGSMAVKRSVAPSLGTFPTTGALWSVLLLGVIVIVGALTYFPALALGPIVEQLLQAAGHTF